MALLYEFITNVFPVIAAIVCAYAAIRLYKKYKKTDIKIVGYFSGFFLFKFLAFVLIISAITVVLTSNNSALARGLMAFGISSMDFGLIFIGLVLITLLGYKYNKTFMALVFVTIAFGYLTINLIYPPSISHIAGTKMGIIMRVNSVSAWYLLLSHLPIMGLLGLTFLAKIPTLTIRALKTRALLLGLGLLSANFGGPLFFFFEGKGPQALMLSITLAGYILIFLGVLLYREETTADR